MVISSLNWKLCLVVIVISSLSLSGLKERLNGLMRSTSTDEVGWALQNVDAPVQDETEEFYRIFEGLK